MYMYSICSYTSDMYVFVYTSDMYVFVYTSDMYVFVYTVIFSLSSIVWHNK